MDDKRFNHIKISFFPLLILLSVVAFVVFFSFDALAQDFIDDEEKISELKSPKSDSVSLKGDVLEYSVDGQIVTARGNVVLTQKETILYCDEVEFSRLTSTASAKGNVRLVNEQGEISGDELTFNFITMMGDFHNARIISLPFFGGARKVSRVSDDKIVMEDGYVTTSDFDKPEFHIASKKIEVYPGDKIVAKHNRFKLGAIPLAYMPRYTQRILDGEPRFEYTPGHNKEWGAFLLTDWRYYKSENLKGTVHLDYRELLDLAWGFDVDYRMPDYGGGVLRTYYTKERKITSDSIFDERPSPTPERQRYKIEWRHKWKIDDKTNAIMQYYLISDREFLKDYFEREHDKDQNPPTFFVLTRALPLGTMSLRSDIRVNRFVSAVERLPELRYDLTNKEIGNTGVYFKNFTTLSNRVNLAASPTEFREETARIHTGNELSYPMKLGFVELNPFVRGEWTYFSRARDRGQDGKIREFLRAGASVQTKFYKIFDINSSFLGEEIDRMRHIITPSMTYNYANDPTIANSQIIQLDSIDSRARSQSINVSLENKLQTKSGDKTREFLRAIVSSTYRFENDPSGTGFAVINSDVDFRPTNWLTLFFDSKYDLNRDMVSTANFDVYINSGKKWKFGLGRRFNASVDDQITALFYYTINPKWKFQLINRFNIEEGIVEEQQYVLTRDLHAWEMDIHVNDEREEGTEFVVIFRLKAFPEVGFDFGTTFNERESGSESEGN